MWNRHGKWSKSFWRFCFTNKQISLNSQVFEVVMSGKKNISTTWHARFHCLIVSTTALSILTPVSLPNLLPVVTVVFFPDIKIVIRSTCALEDRSCLIFQSQWTMYGVSGLHSSFRWEESFCLYIICWRRMESGCLSRSQHAHWTTSFCKNIYM